MRRRSVNWGGIVWIVMILVFGNFGFLSSMFSTGSAQNEPVTEDIYMTTSQYDVTLDVNKDNSYTVTESLDVNFDSYRHGIYRYIPYKGIITEADDNGELTDVPYYAKITDTGASVPLDVSSENGNKVFRLGDEDTEVMGPQNYRITYKAQPVTNGGYDNVYWNIYPQGWRNVIPKGSTFTVTFPKELPSGTSPILYYGSYGEQKDGSRIADVNVDSNVITGTLKEDLPVGNGLTIYASVGAGYFENVPTMMPYNIILIAVSAVVLILLLLLFFFFGRDTQIIPSVQFAPPAGLDSAAVGYIIDGSISDRDIVSLLVFWADRGFLKIRETEEKSLSFTKVKELPEDAPRYARTLFDGIFGAGAGSIGKEVAVPDMKYRLSDTFASVKTLLEKEYKQRIYTNSSKAARVIAGILSVIPIFLFTGILLMITFTNAVILLFAILYLVGLVLFASTVDAWYARTRIKQRLWGSAAGSFCILPFVMLFIFYGIPMMKSGMLNLAPGLLAVAVVSIAAMVLTGFMKKRTEECVAWMGYLIGLRDFIETAELERMQVIAKDDPQLFYHVLPFAYVFGLSDIMLDKMKDLTIPAPDWYEARSVSSPYFNYYLMYHMLHTDMTHVAQTISTPKPVQSSSGSGGGFSGGGFSGGGFSGGGFGGGGGGSW